MTPPCILLTGGAGYIGTHIAVSLLEAGKSVVVVDDLSNSSRRSLERVRSLADGDLAFHHVDVRDVPALDRVFAERPIDTVIHLAGLKSVSESCARPLHYWDVNVGGSSALLKVMADHGVKRLVFSSSCTVYGEPSVVPIGEDRPLEALNPYGRTKLAVETMLRDVAANDPAWAIAVLRYFNPVGAHPSGRIGEASRGPATNLMPHVMHVALGRREDLVVHGGDYDTRDGTCVRDYIHVADVAEAHRLAVGRLDEEPGCWAVNLGTGQGNTVLELVAGVAAVIGRPVPYRIGPRRVGDAAAAYADPSRAHAVLGWRAERPLVEMCEDAWRWHAAHPDGYDSTG